jgi:hypothetical protein
MDTTELGARAPLNVGGGIEVEGLLRPQLEVESVVY